MAKKKDKFGKSDIAQLLVGTFVIASGTFLGSDKEITTLAGVLTFIILLVVAVVIFSIISLTRRGVILRVAVTVPVVILVAFAFEQIITGHISLGHVFLHAGIALPISAGIDAIKD